MSTVQPLLPEYLQHRASRIPGAVPAWSCTVEASELREICGRVKDAGGRIVALWGADNTDLGLGFAVHLTLVVRAGLVCVTLTLPQERAQYPSIDDIFPAANRMQRATYDLLGIEAQDSADQRKWLRHGAWPAETFPLRKSVAVDAVFEREADRYAFVKVEGEALGDGVH